MSAASAMRFAIVPFAGLTMMRGQCGDKTPGIARRAGLTMMCGNAPAVGRCAFAPYRTETFTMLRRSNAKGRHEAGLFIVCR